MRFVAGLLRLSELASSLASPLIQAWLQRNALNSRSRALGRREAVPLPLHAVLALEQAFVDAADDEAYVIGCLLLMIWASLRFSDMQRVHIREAILDEATMRAWSWRTKTSPTGMPWGLLACGFLASDWALLGLPPLTWPSWGGLMTPLMALQGP